MLDIRVVGRARSSDKWDTSVLSCPHTCDNTPNVHKVGTVLLVLRPYTQYTSPFVSLVSILPPLFQSHRAVFVTKQHLFSTWQLLLFHDLGHVIVPLLVS